MYVAVQTELASLDPEEQVKPAIKCLKQVDLEPQVRLAGSKPASGAGVFEQACVRLEWLWRAWACVYSAVVCPSARMHVRVGREGEGRRDLGERGSWVRMRAHALRWRTPYDGPVTHWELLSRL